MPNLTLVVVPNYTATFYGVSFFFSCNFCEPCSIFFLISRLSYYEKQDRVDWHQSQRLIYKKLFDFRLNVQFATDFLVKTIERPPLIFFLSFSSKLLSFEMRGEIL